MTDRIRRLRAVLLAAICGGLFLAAMPDEAAARRSAPHARQAAKAPAAKTVVAAGQPTEANSERVEPTGVWTSGEQDRACFKGRRKLWQDGQGWVVKRVSVCP